MNLLCVCGNVGMNILEEITETAKKAARIVPKRAETLPFFEGFDSHVGKGIHLFER